MLGFKRGYVPGEKFPLLELISLFFPQFASAISITSLFPYVGFMVVHLKLSSNIESAGFYAGYIASAVMLGRMLSSIYWGRFSDKFGRKSVIVICCVTIATTTLLFGLSSSFWFAISTRLLFGLFNPIIGTSKTIASELCSKKHETIGMGIVSGSWYLGLTIGPVIGGLLARPSDLYPDYFGNIYIFNKFPYLLPNLVCSFLGIISLIIVLLYLPETLPNDELSSISSHQPLRLDDIDYHEEDGKEQKSSIQMIVINNIMIFLIAKWIIVIMI